MLGVADVASTLYVSLLRMANYLANILASQGDQMDPGILGRSLPKVSLGTPFCHPWVPRHSAGKQTRDISIKWAAVGGPGH